jgi:hypothetical protein
VKKIITLTLALSFSLSLLKADYWTQKANFTGSGLLLPFSFSIGSKGYIGTGETNTGAFTDDFWEYDPSTNIWTQKAVFGGGGRFEANGFSIGNKGYAGLGFGYSGYLQDFWEYDPSLNSWNQKADFGGVLRVNAVGFSIGSI